MQRCKKMNSTLKSLVTLSAGHSFRGSIENNPKGDVTVIQMKDVDVEKGLDTSSLFRVHLAGRKKPDYLQQGDILFVGRGYRIFAVLIEQPLENTVAGSHFFVLKANHQNVRADYLAWYINHKQAQHYFSQHAVGSALPHVNRTTLEALPVVLPPLTIQEAIVKAHLCRLQEKALLEKLIEKKKQFLDELLNQTLQRYQEGK